MKRLRVGVLYGGRSGEHEVSLASAASIIANLDPQRYDPVPIRIGKDGRWALPDRPPSTVSAGEVIEQGRLDPARAPRLDREVHLVAHPGAETILELEREPAERSVAGGDGQRAYVRALTLDVVFPVLHGPYGEDGTVQGLLELANVPYVGAGVLASATGMDKAVTKVLLAAQGLPVVSSMTVARRRWEADRAGTVTAISGRFAFPVFVKPANLGSSVGVSKAVSPETLDQALDLAAQFDRKMLVEAAVPHAREIECAVLGNDEPEASVPGEIIPAREFYDYEAKYLDNRSALRIPAPLAPDQASELRRMAILAFRAIDGSGMARVDFLVAGDSGTIYVNEVNTIPGFTTISMYPKLWEASGLPFPALLNRLVQLALERHRDKQRLRTSMT